MLSDLAKSVNLYVRTRTAKASDGTAPRASGCNECYGTRPMSGEADPIGRRRGVEEDRRDNAPIRYGEMRFSRLSRDHTWNTSACCITQKIQARITPNAPRAAAVNANRGSR